MGHNKCCGATLRILIRTGYCFRDTPLSCRGRRHTGNELPREAVRTNHCQPCSGRPEVHRLLPSMAWLGHALQIYQVAKHARVGAEERRSKPGILTKAGSCLCSTNPWIAPVLTRLQRPGSSLLIRNPESVLQHMLRTSLVAPESLSTPVDRVVHQRRH